MKMTTSNENVITKKDLQKMFWRSLPMEFSWHYERQMHMGFAFMVAKGLEKIYKDDKKGLSEALERHLEFFNTTCFSICRWYCSCHGRNECKRSKL